MDVDIGEVEAQLAPDSPAASTEAPKPDDKGATELRHEQELAQRRARRLQQRLHAD